MSRFITASSRISARVSKQEASVANDGSVYQTRDPRYDGKKDHFFNESGRMSDPHGHVVESRNSTPGATRYDYVRDADGREYVDRRDFGNITYDPGYGPQH